MYPSHGDDQLLSFGVVYLWRNAAEREVEAPRDNQSIRAAPVKHSPMMSNEPKFSYQTVKAQRARPHPAKQEHMPGMGQECAPLLSCLSATFSSWLLAHPKHTVSRTTDHAHLEGSLTSSVSSAVQPGCCCSLPVFRASMYSSHFL